MALDSNYDPKKTEQNIYEKWMQNEVGKPEIQTQKQGLKNSVGTHSILMPPPNLTGKLHTGHSFQHYLMDTLSRIERQKGRLDFWAPGVDHAGIQLEGVIDKLILKGEFDDQINKQNLDLPEKKQDWAFFLKKNHTEFYLSLAWEKVELWRNNQKEQSSLLGDTPDYSRNLFTLDPRSKDMVFQAFWQYYKDGLIYKGPYLVNWSVGLQTALSDVSGDIEYTEMTDPLITFEYVLKSGIFNEKTQSKFSDEKRHIFTEAISRIRVSTVRPETVFGDVAILVNKTVFKNLLLNFASSRGKLSESDCDDFINDIENGGIVSLYEIPGLISNVKLILGNDTEVDPNFGTGALKITPASDHHDYEIFRKYLNGDFPKAIGRDGKLTRVCGEFGGLTVEQGRLAVIERLAKTGYLSVKAEFFAERENVLDEVRTNLELEKFNATDYSYEEGKKRLQEILGDAGQKLEIDWNYTHNVTLCERSKTVIEPLISEEFFLDFEKEFSRKKPITTNKLRHFQDFAFDLDDPDIDLNYTIESELGLDDKIQIEEKLDAELSKRVNLKTLGLEGVSQIQFFSTEYREMAVNFVENIHNWCISRDLVWGHPIPVWYNLKTNPEKQFFNYNEVYGWASPFNRTDGNIGDTNHPYYKMRISQEKPTDDGDWVREEKIFDTWFSSCLWPLTVYNFPEYKQKQPKAIIIHGGTSSLNYSEIIDDLENYELNLDTTWEKWKDNLAKNLENQGVLVAKPQMPNKLNAKYKEWEIWFKKILKTLTSTENLYLIGHSLGANFLLKYLSENSLVVEGLYLVSPCVDIGDFIIENDLAKISETAKNVQIFHSRDDKVVPFTVAQEIANKIPNSKVNIFENRGHFNQTEFVELQEAILTQTDGFRDLNLDFDRFYPTQEMTTAKEIFYIWVVRMIILSKYFTGLVPFEKVIIHPTVLDEKGRKMSKSLGNGLDPVEAINKFSSDSLRLAMLSGMIPNRNMRLGGALADRLMEKYRNFGNKLWNVARFLESKSTQGD